MSAFADDIRLGDVRAIAQAITSAENGEAAQLLAELGNVHVHRVLGVTGAPGVGKSTLVSALISELRSRGLRVAALLVDPSSVLTGGSLLGDRIRLQSHAGDTCVFIRSLATRGHLGGLTSTISDVLTIMQATPFDIIILETVGVGQSEVEVMHHADVVAFVVAPGLGDGIQAAKAGVLEIADVVVLNKAELPGAAATHRELAQAGLISRTSQQPLNIIETVAATSRGVSELLDALLG